MDQIHIPLGSNCAPTYHLERLGLRKCAYPFDWSKISLCQLINVLEDKFENYSNLSLGTFSNSHKSLVLSNSYGIKFAHEISSNEQKKDLEKSFVSRVQRFKDLKYRSNQVRLYRIEISVIKPNTYIKTICRLIDLLDIYINNYVLVILVQKDLVNFLQELNLKNKIILLSFESYSQDWQMNMIDWKQVFNS
jgi:hypothetical protein